jgi:hypothetical protein
MKTLTLLALLISSLSGCTSVRSGTRYETINRIGTGATGNVTMASGTSLDVRSLRVTADSTYWQLPGSLDLISVPTSGVASISYRTRQTGMFYGMRNGMIVGGAVMGLLGALDNRSCSAPPGQQPTGDFGLPCSSALGGVAGALWGAFWGAAVGGLTGSATRGNLRFRLGR